MPESKPIRRGIVFYVKTVAEDYLQAAHSLLEKGCFFGSVVVLCCSAFESASKWKIRFLLKRTSKMTNSQIDCHLNRIQGNQKRPLVFRIADELEKLYGNNIRDKLLALSYWNDLDAMVKMRNKVVHTGFIGTGAIPTKEDAHKYLNVSRKIVAFMNKEIVI
ncbi:MAG: hypothetical protein V2A64_00845 [Candidatus Omnitrophota bacterium]